MDNINSLGFSPLERRCQSLVWGQGPNRVWGQGTTSSGSHLRASPGRLPSQAHHTTGWVYGYLVRLIARPDLRSKGGSGILVTGSEQTCKG